MQRVCIALPVLIIALVLHECAHGIVANFWGDSTAKDQGRITLNPLPHIDPFGTVVLPILTLAMGFGFAWAKPVPIDPRRFRRYRPALFMVSMAGIVMNLLLAFASAAVFCVI